ncbi:glycosyltransferase family 2 protein [Naasia sp. SYSU D00057]|uniref:glycosyltransferase n=1 Tax=Naasia sp. SYSU D00057 TaxID=2817380 RepID=UPI001B30CA00|nr:glycosyltransferase family 2 protein [Naasia sp. SYSU D00057]
MSGAPAERIAAEYVLPLRWSDDAGLGELTAYLRGLSDIVDVTVVDGSPADVFAEHASAWSGLVRHVPPDPNPFANGKVAGVLTGVRLARWDAIVLADDDVRYDEPGLRRLVGLLAGADAVRPQNVFSPLPWHAREDTARSLINRAFAADYPGTLGLRRSVLQNTGGYDGDVLFENLELLRTIRAVGGRELSAPDLYVRRLPPTARHFLGQRVRQAYDDFAQPARLVAELALLPAALLALRRPRLLLLAAAGAIALAEVGRRRHGGARVYRPTAALWAPVWVAERAVCVWLALARRLTGGVPYAGGRLRSAGTPMRVLRRRLAGQPHSA